MAELAAAAAALRALDAARREVRATLAEMALAARC
jgi:hypothetical protein